MEGKQEGNKEQQAAQKSAYERWKETQAEDRLQDEILAEMTPAQREAYTISNFKRPSDYMTAFHEQRQTW